MDEKTDDRFALPDEMSISISEKPKAFREMEIGGFPTGVRYLLATPERAAAGELAERLDALYRIILSEIGEDGGSVALEQAMFDAETALAKAGRKA